MFGGVPGVYVKADTDREIASGEVADVTTSVQIDPVDLDRPSVKLLFRIVAEDDPSVANEDEARFLRPR